jgi:hypothetical protein
MEGAAAQEQLMDKRGRRRNVQKNEGHLDFVNNLEAKWHKPILEDELSLNLSRLNNGIKSLCPRFSVCSPRKRNPKNTVKDCVISAIL